MAEEATGDPCDTGSELDVLKEEFPEHVDFNSVQHGWWVHEGEYGIDTESLNARAVKLRKFIRDRPEKEVVLVSHGFFNHYMTGDVNEKGEQTTGWWQETELRTYTFVEGDAIAMIEETEESLSHRDASEDEVKANPEDRAQADNLPEVKT